MGEVGGGCLGGHGEVPRHNIHTWYDVRVKERVAHVV
jgi:hypothetical protein